MKAGRDILSEYGNDSGAGEKPRAKSGGCTEAETLDMKTPVGPKGIDHKGVGLGGTNHGYGPQGRH